MAKFYESISDDLREFIAAQHIFFVATAPLSAEGHVNVSPKGMDSLRVLSPNRVAYLDLTGSGNETSAHVRENSRITLMVCAFDGAPNIVRLYGKGRSVLPDTTEWGGFCEMFPRYPGARQVIVVEVERVQTSCGYAVPLFDYVSDRDTLVKWAEHKGEDGLTEYHREKNWCSIDGLPTPLAEGK
ncbi:MAG TPA: pyridoxamine 5'-phosphate oxidase family protein [Aggregatilineales bacterium]|nr:pyridoxamine 5'-phosphate oxidase family protein [Aggregatilineales bacterium]